MLSTAWQLPRRRSEPPCKNPLERYHLPVSRHVEQCLDQPSFAVNGLGKIFWAAAAKYWKATVPMNSPARLQLSRRAGFDLQKLSHSHNDLSATRMSQPGKWGNPFVVGMPGIPSAAEAVKRFRLDLLLRLTKDPDPLEQLRQKNLACWCRLGEPCHPELLLDLTNK